MAVIRIQTVPRRIRGGAPRPGTRAILAAAGVGRWQVGDGGQRLQGGFRDLSRSGATCAPPGGLFLLNCVFPQTSSRLGGCGGGSPGFGAPLVRATPHQTIAANVGRLGVRQLGGTSCPAGRLL